ncbi:hypothetical protein [Fortiea contorta]|uniref:hypothetical protein n=1 Tax=Fortiea contorta TaxID=1892405 RepID=UPI00034BA6E3|nr:hypothetical protein [Fortiea contorta]
MHLQIQDLEIKNKEVHKITGIKRNKLPKSSIFYNPIKKFIFVFFSLRLLLAYLFLSLFTLAAISTASDSSLVEKDSSYIFLFFIAIIILLIILISIKRNIDIANHKFKPLSKILEEVDKHNKLVRDIDILDQLKAAGNPVNLDNRLDVIKAINTTKQDLLRALKTEKILRDNPEFNPEYFTVDITTLEALKISEKATEYGQILEQALNIEINLQIEMKNIFTRIPTKKRSHS